MKRSGSLFRLGGVAVAGIGFGVTRLFVVEAVRTETTFAFLFAGLLPLMLGLGVTAYGVGLAVGSFSRTYVATVARWCLLGTGAMLGVLAITSFGTMLDGGPRSVLSASPLLAANVLLAGTVGGIVLGTRSARAARQQGHIQRQANRALLLDRLLRHEVINAVTIIRGNARLLSDNAPATGAVETIERASERIATTIEDVGTLVDEPDTDRGVDVAATLTAEIETARSAFPETEMGFDGPTQGVDAAADERLRLVYRELLENAGEHPETDRVAVDLRATNYEVVVTVADDGPGLSTNQRELLQSGVFPEYDDPSAGFGLQVVRLLVHEYDGSIAVTDGFDGEGTAIKITLPRVDVDRGLPDAIGVSLVNLHWGTATGLLAGVAMAVFWVLAADILPVIGSLYGVQSPTIGLVTHLFHSVIFAFVFVGATATPAVEPYVDGPLQSGLAGLVWGTLLWLVAAGVIMPVWLQGLGVMATLPNLPPLGFVSHALWGSVLGASYAVLLERPVGYLGLE